MKQGIFKSLALAAVLAAAAVPAAAETVLKVGSVVPSGSPWGKWAAGVAAAIEEKSGGELKLDLLLDSQVGDEQTIQRQTTKGRIDMALVSNVPLTLLSEEMAIPTAAYLYDSTDQGTCVSYNHLEATFGDMMKGAGVIPLTWVEGGRYVLFSRVPAKVPGDLAGKKFRIAPALNDQLLATAWGVQGIPMGTSDMIPALQTGAVDAAWTSTVFGLAIGVPKVAPHVIVTRHARLIGSININEKSWNSLSAEHQAILKGVFQAAGPQLTNIILGAEDALLKKAADAGVPVYYPTEAEMAEWKAPTGVIVDQLVAEIGGNAQAVVDAITAAKAACGS